MSESLLHLCDSLSSEPHGLVVRKPLLRTFLDYGQDLVSYSIVPGMIVCGKNPLKPFSDPQKTKDLELPDISPFKPFVSLPSDNIYQDTEVFRKTLHTQNAEHILIFLVPRCSAI
jgi:hypothetical protein